MTVTVQEAAKELGCSPELVYKLCREKKLRHHRLGVTGGGKIVIRPEHIVEFLNEREVAPYSDGEPDGPKRVRRLRGVVIPDIVGDLIRERQERSRSRTRGRA